MSKKYKVFSITFSDGSGQDALVIHEAELNEFKAGGDWYGCKVEAIEKIGWTTDTLDTFDGI